MNPNDAIWKPNVTVAAVIEQDGKFLLVEEETTRGALYNQPAGHLEPDESLIASVIRETLEETAHHFVPRALLGVYHYRYQPNNVTYMRFAFTGEVAGSEAGRKLDTGIIRAVWMTADEVRASSARHRTPLVTRCVEDYLSGRRYPLDLITHHGPDR
jgi:ADP-ribose pyrophosphatase YjhB (NUDIX family)